MRTPSKYRRWTADEDAKLAAMYQTHTLSQLAPVFNRGWNKIGRRAMRLGIRKDNDAFREAHRQGALKAFAEGRATNAGAKNPNWRGGKNTMAGYPSGLYSTVHCWLVKTFGKATKCESVSCIGRSQTFQWAKIKGYAYEKKRENFIMLCRSCHTKYDSYT